MASLRVQAELMQMLISIIIQISAISDYRCAVKKTFVSLVRILKLLTPLFEEILDISESVPDESFRALSSLKKDLESAKELLRFGNEGSRIYLVLEREQIMKKYQELTARLEQDLSGVSVEKLNISDEVKEQVALVLAQFGRAKGRIDAQDVELHKDLLSLYNKPPNVAERPAKIRRIIEKLQLTKATDINNESIMLHGMVNARRGDPSESIGKMLIILERIKKFMEDDGNIYSRRRGSFLRRSNARPIISNEYNKNVEIPADFLCPISLELMMDPVIVTTGQTYDRPCIEKWFEDGNRNCPTTQQIVTDTSVIPNYALRSLIAQWCESNRIETPLTPSSSTSIPTPTEQSMICRFLPMLKSSSPDDQRAAAGEFHLLAKRNSANRLAIAQVGAIPLLTSLLTAPDSRTQQHAVAALFNLSIYEDNIGTIMASGAIPRIVQVLRKGTMEARETAAATIFNLSVIDKNKVTIGSLGAVAPLVSLLSEGAQRGKKDAATALFNLCMAEGNTGRAVRAGVVPTLMLFLIEPHSMRDDALALLAILSSHHEGQAAIGKANAVHVLVREIGAGSQQGKENAATVLMHLSWCDQKYLAEAQQLGVKGFLVDLVNNGTDRGKRKAGQLLEKIANYAEEPAQAQSLVQPHYLTAAQTLLRFNSR